MLKSKLPTLVSGSSICSGSSFIVKYLLHPKTSSRTVQKAEQGEMVVLGGIAGKFNDRSMSIENTPASIQHEMIVGCDKCISDSERSMQ